MKISVDNGNGKQRKIIDMTSSTLEIEKRKVPFGIYAFSSNECVSTFFQKREESILENNVEAN